MDKILHHQGWWLSQDFVHQQYDYTPHRKPQTSTTNPSSLTKQLQHTHGIYLLCVYLDEWMDAMGTGMINIACFPAIMSTIVHGNVLHQPTLDPH